MKRKMIATLGLAALATVGLASCGESNNSGTKTYRTTTTVSPSNWNALTYQDNNDTQIISYIGSNFFTFDYKYDAQGNIVDGDFTVKYEAATKLEDVTTTYAKDDNYAVPDDATKGYAYKITLRNDLKWDDGTAIKADDFIYTMQEQLNPKFLNYRADSFYNGSLVLHNAENYVKQGQETQATVSTVMANEGKTLEAFLEAHGTQKTYINWDYSFGATYSNGAWTDSAEDETVDSKLPLSQMYEVYIAKALGFVDEATAKQYFMDEVSVDYTFPEMSFDKVGMKKGSNDYEIVLILDSSLSLLKDDGSLSYQAAYNLSDLPLVKKDLYEANKVEPAAGSTLWTSTYNNSVASTASWGPYKLTEFQAGKSYTLVKNDKWFGYSLPENKGLYQTDIISCETIEEYETRLLKFLAGEIDDIGIDVSVSNTYKNSEQAIFTPSDYVGSMQLQSSATSLKNREKDGVDKEILTNVKFRKAISLGFDRVAYNQTCTTSSKAGFGLFNSMHYYDVENGGVYRNTDAAKKTLCETYGIDVSKYTSLDKAYAAITGYDLKAAQALVKEAYEEELAKGTISATDKVVLTIGSGAQNESTLRVADFITKSLKEICKNTPLEGRIDTEFVNKGTKWAKDFREGGYDICTGGWTGAAWNPGYFLLAYLSPAYMYSSAWDTSSVMMKYTVTGGNTATNEDVTDTMSLIDWYNCLNGNPGCKYNWSAGVLKDEERCKLIAALEKEILSVYYTVPISYSFSAEMISYKIEYKSRDYNTFMSYGGFKYMTYNYDDAHWKDFVASQGGKIDYTK